MATRGIQLSERPPVPVRNIGSEGTLRNEERFRAQVIEMFRDRDREIGELRLLIEQQTIQVTAQQVQIDDLETRVAALEAAP